MEVKVRTLDEAYGERIEKSKQVQVKPYQRKGRAVLGYQRFDPRTKTYKGKEPSSGIKLRDGTNVRIYDIGEGKEADDRYTAVFDSKEWNESVNPGMKAMLGFSGSPEHPQGVSQFSEGREGSHLGKRIPFSSLPEELQNHVIKRALSGEEDSVEAAGDLADEARSAKEPKAGYAESHRGAIEVIGYTKEGIPKLKGVKQTRYATFKRSPGPSGKLYMSNEPHKNAYTFVTEEYSNGKVLALYHQGEFVQRNPVKDFENSTIDADPMFKHYMEQTKHQFELEKKPKEKRIASPTQGKHDPGSMFSVAEPKDEYIGSELHDFKMATDKNYATKPAEKPERKHPSFTNLKVGDIITDTTGEKFEILELDKKGRRAFVKDKQSPRDKFWLEAEYINKPHLLAGEEEPAEKPSEKSTEKYAQKVWDSVVGEGYKAEEKDKEFPNFVNYFKKLGDAIKNKDTGFLKKNLHAGNKQSIAFFNEMTGNKGTNQKQINEAIERLGKTEKSLKDLEKSKQVQVKPYQRKGRFVVGYSRRDPRGDMQLLEAYQDMGDVDAGREIARRINSGRWTLGSGAGEPKGSYGDVPKPWSTKPMVITPTGDVSFPHLEYGKKPEGSPYHVSTEGTKHLSTTERAKIIRNKLKSMGIKSSVRSEYFSMGSSIRVEVKMWVPIEQVEKIANEHENISYDQFSGEILSGGNRYVHVGFDSSLKPTPQMVDAVKRAIDSITFGEGWTPDSTRYYHWTNILMEQNKAFDKSTWRHILSAVLAEHPEIDPQNKGYHKSLEVEEMEKSDIVSLDDAFEDLEKARTLGARDKRKRKGRELSVPEQHQLRIVTDNLRNPLKGHFLGGPTGDEAKEIYQRLTGRAWAEPYTEPKKILGDMGIGKSDNRYEVIGRSIRDDVTGEYHPITKSIAEMFDNYGVSDTLDVMEAVVEDALSKGKVYDPAAVAAAVGRKKYGAKKFAEMAVVGRKRKKQPKGKARMAPGGGGRFAKLESDIASKKEVTL